MRQRKVKNEEEKLAVYERYIVKDLESKKGKWHELFGNDQKIFMEIGCGKGKFATTLAENNPECNYIAVEGSGSVVLRALEKAANKGLTNILFISQYVRNLDLCFDQGEIDGIYLNFSDPWPKEKHARRRLTYKSYLEEYRYIMKPQGVIEFKTDNDALFEFSLNEFKENGLIILEQTNDLHASDLKAKEVTTEYEDKFNELFGEKINYLKAKFGDIPQTE